MLTLLIDNYDSFTYNLFQLLAEENGKEPIVVRNDEASWEELARLGFDNVVLSPGPGRPERARDFGVCAEAIRHCEAPLLGVCLGHQGLGWVHGGRVVPAPEPMHGRVRTVEHAGAPLFAGIPARFEATRYHSLCLERPLPPDLEEIAWSEDGVVMALAHRSRPQWGVQFHPESIATEHGRRLLANFRDLTATSSDEQRRAAGQGAFVTQEVTNAPRPSRSPGLKVRRLEVGVDPARAFRALYGESPNVFWLDSSSPANGGRFSFMGDASGPLSATIAYDVDAHEVTVKAEGRPRFETSRSSTTSNASCERLRPLANDLPFDFDCGFAGYLGYELKADCGSPNTHSSPHPDAALIFADRLIAFDHDLGHTYLLGLCDLGTEQAAETWLSATEASLSTLATSSPTSGTGASFGAGGRGARRSLPAVAPSSLLPWPEPSAPLARSHDEYLAAIAECEAPPARRRQLRALPDEPISTEVDADPLALYIELRRVNPAPFASYLRFGDLAVLSSSPERFLSVDREGRAEAKPIKGTAPRGASADEDTRLAARLRDDEKNRAENLMIVDLLRNDLGSVCAVGSVEVPSLMAVESYETVHQLVSTVRGRLRPGTGAVACARACFPPGSMTGAPKLRSVEILDRLEGRARGVYSGAIGYFGLGGGCDLSVTIRTIVLDGAAATIGAGGAIVLQSDPEQEYEEMLLKAAAPLRALGAIEIHQRGHEKLDR